MGKTRWLSDGDSTPSPRVRGHRQAVKPQLTVHKSLESSALRLYDISLGLKQKGFSHHFLKQIIPAPIPFSLLFTTHALF